MFGVSPLIELMKLPTPFPSEVLLSAMVGLATMLQHTPRTVTVEPPLSSTVPPDCAVVVVMLVMDTVVTVGITGSGMVLNVFSSP